MADNAIREKIFTRQKSLGVIPSDAVLTAENSEAPRWKDIPEDFRPVLAREMESMLVLLSTQTTTLVAL